MCDGGCECGDAGVSPTRRESAYDMVRVADAVRRVLAAAVPLEGQQVAARKAKGLVLAAPVHSSVRRGGGTA
jgi:molybdopterin biosynthesis enzyme